jgi:hypothetical protein
MRERYSALPTEFGPDDITVPELGTALEACFGVEPLPLDSGAGPQKKFLQTVAPLGWACAKVLREFSAWDMYVFTPTIREKR